MSEVLRDRPPVVAVKGLSKTFSGVTVLDSVSLEVQPGEVHGLLGENGSGKSTFIKLLAGFHDPDPGGELRVNGTNVSLPLSPGRFRDLGISFVHQDLGLVSDLSVMENMTIGSHAQGQALAPISWRKHKVALGELLNEYGIDVDLDATISTLAPTERALLAIVRAVEELKRHTSAEQPALIILDEPTVFLPESGVRRMFELIREMVQLHASVIFVSHDLDEVMEHTDRLTVLRNGSLAGSVVTAEATHSQVVEMIIGRHLAQPRLKVAEPDQNPDDRVPCLTVSAMRSAQLNGVSLHIHAGEIVGITGLMGSGYEALLYALYGYHDAIWDAFTINGVDVSSRTWSPQRAIDVGMGLVPADRKNDGIAAELSVQENAMLLVLRKFARHGVLRVKVLADRARELIRDYDVRPRRTDIAIGSLSGGNQQKVVLARLLQTSPQLLLLDEPTQGVDIGAREQILTDIVQRADRDGMGVLCASTDYEQLERICTRVVITEGGAIVGELRDEQVTKERIAQWVLNKSARTS